MFKATRPISFRSRSPGLIELGLTATGHPIPVDQLGPSIPSEELLASLPDHLEVALLQSPRRVYMAHLAGGSNPPIDEGKMDFPKLYPKKVPLVVQNFLTGTDALPKETFLSWWKRNKIGRDFWIETKERMIRIHVTLRRTWFDPRDWKTDQNHLKKKLLESLGRLCRVDLIPCVIAGPPQAFTYEWNSLTPSREQPMNLWIGRSSFANLHEATNSEPNVLYADIAMEDAKGRPDEDAEGHGHTLSPLLDGAGAQATGGGEQARQGDRDHAQADRQDESDGAQGGGRKGGDRCPGEVDPGLAATTPTRDGRPIDNGGSIRTLPGMDVPRSAGGAPAVDHQRGGEERKRVRGPDPVGDLGKKPEDRGGEGAGRREALQVDQQDGEGPGDSGSGSPVTGAAVEEGRAIPKPTEPDGDLDLGGRSGADCQVGVELAALRDKNNLEREAKTE